MTNMRASVVLAIAGLVIYHTSHAQEDGWHSDRHTVVLAADSDRVYLGMAQDGVSLMEAIRSKWEVFSAPVTGGDLVKEHLEPFQFQSWEKLQGVQHVAMHPSKTLAVIAARRDRDDLDLFVSYLRTTRITGVNEGWTTPMPLDGLNTEFDEVFPRWEGRDIHFSSNREGHFALYRSKAVTQWLRAEHNVDLPIHDVDVLSSVVIGLGRTWVSSRKSSEELVEVSRLNWPEASSRLGQGWAFCMKVNDQIANDQLLVIRDMATRQIVDNIRTELSGCADLEGVPNDRSWVIQWMNDDWIGEVNDAVVEILDPHGNVVRRFNLSAANRWELVLLPLDQVDDVGLRVHEDRSSWPYGQFVEEVGIVFFAFGEATPSENEWSRLKDWASMQPTPNEGTWMITGYADSTGTESFNQSLSWERARGIAKQLSTCLNWPMNQIKVEGAGSSESFGSIPSQNRRVEVRWVPSMQ